MSLTALVMHSIYFALFLGGLIRPVLGVLGYLAIYFIHNPYYWWVDSTRHFFFRPSFIAASFLIAGSLIHFSKLNWSISRKEIEFYLFLGACWLSTALFGIGFEADTREYLTKITKVFIFVFFLIRVVNSMENLRLVIWAFILSGLFLAYQAHLLDSVGRLNTIGGIDFGEANGLAAFLAITIIFAAFRFLNAYWLKKVFYVAAIALMANTVILTQSRAVTLGVIAAVPYVIFRMPPKKYKQIIVYMVLGVIMFIGLADQRFISRMRTIDDEAQSAGSSNIVETDRPLSRLDFWRASIRIFKDHPMGIGIKNFQKIVPLYDPRNPGKDVHNTYIMCYSEIGVIGIFLFLIIIAETIFQLNRIWRTVRGTAHESEILPLVTALGAVLMVYLCGYMMTHSILYNEILWILLALPICLENAAVKIVAEESSPFVGEAEVQNIERNWHDLSVQS